MSLDERLRQDLSRAAEGVHPDIEHHLARVIQRARGRTRMRWLGRALAAAALIFAFVAIDLVVIQNRTTPFADAVQGTFSAQVDTSETLLDRAGMAGDWSMRFDSGGDVEVTAPSTYRGILSTVLYRASAVSFRINLFETDLCSGEGLGSYTWQISNGVLRFSTVEDTCVERVALLTERQWQRSD